MMDPGIFQQNQRVFSMSPGSGYVDPKSVNFMAPGASSAGRPDPNAQAAQQAMAKSRARIMGNTEGRAKELANDPRMNQAQDFFSRVMGGAEGPYTDASKAAMVGQRAKAAGDAQASQMRALQEAAAASGGSVYDPSFQAKAQEMNSQRQGRVMDAQGEIESAAAGANFNAKMGGATSLVGARSGQNAQINSMRGLAADYQSRDQAFVPSTGGAQLPPTTVGGITTRQRAGFGG